MAVSRRDRVDLVGARGVAERGGDRQSEPGGPGTGRGSRGSLQGQQPGLSLLGGELFEHLVHADVMLAVQRGEDGVAGAVAERPVRGVRSVRARQPGTNGGQPVWVGQLSGDDLRCGDHAVRCGMPVVACGVGGRRGRPGSIIGGCSRG